MEFVLNGYLIAKLLKFQYGRQFWPKMHWRHEINQFAIIDIASISTLTYVFVTN